MADEEKVAPTQFLLDGPEVPTYYADATGMWVGSSDVTLYFGRHYPLHPNPNSASTVVKVVLTHEHFVTAVRLWLSRLLVLDKAYGDKKPGIAEVPQDVMDKLWDAAKSGAIFDELKETLNATPKPDVSGEKS